MKKCVRTFLHSALILWALGIIVQVNAQPVLVKEIPVNSTNFVEAANLVYFTSGTSLWRTDGTSSGTISLRSGFNFDNWNFTRFFGEFDGSFFFMNNNHSELWRSDGTPGGTILLKTSASSITLLDTTDQYLFFQASDAGSGRELYRTDGTAAGTQVVKDINPGPNDSNPLASVRLGSHTYFFAD